MVAVTALKIMASRSPSMTLLPTEFHKIYQMVQNLIVRMHRQTGWWSHYTKFLLYEGKEAKNAENHPHLE
jgi:hypothetical protein